MERMGGFRRSLREGADQQLTLTGWPVWAGQQQCGGKTVVIEARASHRVSSSLASGYQNRLEKRCQVSMAARFYRPFLCCEVTLSENTGTLKASRTSLFVDCGLHGEFVALSLTVLCFLRTKHTSWLTHFG